MNKFSGKFERIHEETLYRYQQGGFLRGDYVKIRENALKQKITDNFSDQIKQNILTAIKQDTMFRISYIKSGASETFSGPVDAPNIANDVLWADCYEEYAPGMWNNVMTLPLSILEKINIEGVNGFPPYNKSLIRPNSKESTADSSDLEKQTKGSDVNRKLTNKNSKLKEDHIYFNEENNMIFENYLALK